jgi:hypothetical protein
MMANPIGSSSELKWTAEQDHLLSALQVLSTIQPKEKIRIINAPTFSIAIETRYWFRRSWSQDGCKPTIDLISKVMQKCLSFSSIALQNPPKDEKANIKHLELKKLYLPAIIGICHLRDLYASKEENELEQAKDLTEKINGYIASLYRICEDDEKLCEDDEKLMPQAVVPIDPSSIPPSLTTKLAVNVALPILASACSSVSMIGTVMSFRGIIWELITMDTKAQYAGLKLLYSGLRILNLSAFRP